MSTARAYIYNGMWVADCPAGCNSTEKITGAGFRCSYCGRLAEIEWPSQAGEIMAVLELRPFAYNRNWYPEGHLVAMAANVPHGQTVDDLIQENADHGIEGDR
jgi:hypothetical protein